MFGSFDDLIARLSPHEVAFTVRGECSSGIPPEASFRHIFLMEDAELNEYGAMISDWSKIAHETRKYLAKLHWLIRALVQFQDVLSVMPREKPQHSGDLFEVLCRHHCYYEALVHLRSGILSLVNVNTNSTIGVLRPVVEQFVYFIYWDTIQAEGGISKYNTWIRTGKGKPPFKHATEKVESTLKSRYGSIAKRISRDIDAIREVYGTLCSWVHTPIIGESFTAGGLGPTQGNFPGWVSCIHMYNAALITILRLCTYQYPIVLFPVDLIRKWGCSMPIGAFVDRCSGAIIEEALGPKEAAKLRTIFGKDREVSDKLQYASGFPELTDDAILESWYTSSFRQDGLECPKDISRLAAQLKTQVRSLAWALNYLPQAEMEEGCTAQEKNLLREFYGQ